MASSHPYLFIMWMLLLFSFPLFHLRVCYSASSSSSSVQPLCHDGESSALLQFKESLAIDESASRDPFAYPKMASWKLEGESADCCSWDGVECDEDTGHVIGLDLESSWLFGSINSSSSLFRLIHLRRLNLTDNNFNQSKIPAGIGNLSGLTQLDLSYSNFAGQIPLEILELSRLVSLDLSRNSLKLQNPSFRSLVEKLTNLNVLSLSHVSISSKIPQTLANFSSLTFLALRECGLHGEFPIGIFQLPNLRILSVRYNPRLTGYLPEFEWGSPLELLWLAGTSFYGQLPESIGKHKSLNSIDASECYFSGPLPSSLGNLTKINHLDLSSNNFSGKIPSSLVNLLQLSYIDLSFNNFSPSTLHWLGNLTNLSELYLTKTNSYGDIPSSLRNFTQITVLKLFSNQLTGQIPSWLGNLTHLAWIGLASNQLHGPIPKSIFGLRNLNLLALQSNFLSGTLKLDLFLQLTNLVNLQLSDNNLSLLTSPSANVTHQRFDILGLASCNLTEFPVFLRDQNEVKLLELSNNKIEGLVPKWLTNLGTKTPWVLNLAGNLLTGFEQPFAVHAWNNLLVLNLSFNKFQGSLPIPPPSIISYEVSNNRLDGEISPMICKLTSLVFLDLSNNNLSGVLPQCLGNLTNHVSVLNLGNNSFSGKIPQIYMSGCSLRMIDFSQNKLEGTIPRSLANCTKLETLILGENRINDIFPSWLGTLPELKVLILRSNRFHGVIGKPKTKFDFSKLQIVDLSHNNFTSKLPFEYFNAWIAMKSVHNEHLNYMHANTSFQIQYAAFSNQYPYSMTMTNKGNKMKYDQIQDILVAIDFSSNRFEGGIPKAIGDLKGLYLLNLSNNSLASHIPSSLANLKELEALDLSQNQLSGEIPMELTQLTFLEFFNVSHNFLTGPIPSGKQFDTFENNSFDANPGLCGKPLSKGCGNNEDSSLAPSAFEDNLSSGIPLEFGWEVVLIGFATGLVIGVAFGCTVNTRKHERFVKIMLARWQQKVKSGKRNLRRN